MKKSEIALIQKKIAQYDKLSQEEDAKADAEETEEYRSAHRKEAIMLFNSVLTLENLLSDLLGEMNDDTNEERFGEMEQKKEVAHAYKTGYEVGFAQAREEFEGKSREETYLDLATEDQREMWGIEFVGWCAVCGKPIDGKWTRFSKFCPYCGRAMVHWTNTSYELPEIDEPVDGYVERTGETVRCAYDGHIWICGEKIMPRYAISRWKRKAEMN